MKKTPEERKNIILGRLAENGRMSVDTLATDLGVSPMTLNRDVRDLAAEGKIRRMHGLILLPEDAPAGDVCTLCRREVADWIQFLLVFPSRKTALYCCPHCGLAQINATPRPVAVFATDFLYRTLIDAYSATYLVGSRINLCCQPSTLCFSSLQDAQDFQKGFGGECCDMEGAIRRLYQQAK